MLSAVWCGICFCPPKLQPPREKQTLKRENQKEGSVLQHKTLQKIMVVPTVPDQDPRIALFNAVMGPIFERDDLEDPTYAQTARNDTLTKPSPEIQKFIDMLAADDDKSD